MDDANLVRRELFGGAIELDVPSRFVDVSDFRPVPDSQEIFADGSVDQSIVIEAMEHSKAAAMLSRPAEFYFRELGDANDASSANLEDSFDLSQEAVPGLLPEMSKSLATGQQAISKGNQGEEAENLVQISVAVFQIPEHDSDLLVTFNIPRYISEKSAAAEQAGAGEKQGAEQAKQLFLRILHSLVIKDYGLFE